MKTVSFKLSSLKLAALSCVFGVIGFAQSASAVQVTESSPVYVAPSVSSPSTAGKPSGVITSVPDAPTAPKSVDFTQSAKNQTMAASDSDEIEDFGIIADSSEPANPLADDRGLLIEELQMLRSRVEQQTLEISALKKQNKALYEDLDRRIQNLMQKVVKLETSSGGVVQGGTANGLVASGDTSASDAQGNVSDNGSTTAQNSKSTETDQSRYRMAKQILDEGGRDTKAALEFVKLLRDYPDTPLKPNVYYWLAQIYKRSGENEKAESFYNRVIDEYPKSIKAASSMYSLASMKKSQGLTDESQKLFKKLVDQYPASVEAGKAKASLQ